MRKLRSLTGMSVICGSRRIGRVLQAELTGDLRQLSGIWVGAGLLGTRFIPSESLEMLGEVAVMAEDRGKRRPMRAKPLLKRARLTRLNSASLLRRTSYPDLTPTLKRFYPY